MQKYTYNGFLFYILLIEKKVRGKSELNTFKLSFEHLKEMSKVLQSQLDVWTAAPPSPYLCRIMEKLFYPEWIEKTFCTMDLYKNFLL